MSIANPCVYTYVYIYIHIYTYIYIEILPMFIGLIRAIHTDLLLYTDTQGPRDGLIKSKCVLRRVAACCSVLQCVAVLHRSPKHGMFSSRSACCSVLQCVAVCCSVLQCVAVCCSVLHVTPNVASVEVNSNRTLQHTTMQCSHCNIRQHCATHCNTLHHTASHCITLQHTATHCNTLQRYLQLVCRAQLQQTQE